MTEADFFRVKKAVRGMNRDVQIDLYNKQKQNGQTIRINEHPV